MPAQEITYRPANGVDELRQILELQRINQPGSLSDQELRVEGFVTLTHTLSMLQKMQVACPQFVVAADGKVIGYALCLHPELACLVPDLEEMFRVTGEVLGELATYRVMGQVCIAREYRQQGHFRALYQALKQYCDPHPLVTEVAVANQRSLNAHLAIGFSLLARRGNPGREWEVLVWK